MGYSVHLISWNTYVLNNVWNWHAPVELYESNNYGNRILFTLNLFPTEKQITAHCSLRDDFKGNFMFINDVTVTS